MTKPHAEIALERLAPKRPTGRTESGVVVDASAAGEIEAAILNVTAPGDGAPPKRNVHGHRPGLERARMQFRFLSLHPPTAGAVAEKLFTRPRRFKRPAWEQAVLAQGQAFAFTGPRGRQICAWSYGSGPAIALVHGWEGRGSQLGAFVAPLVAAGFRVVLFDAPAHGDTSGRSTDVRAFAETLVALDRWVGGLHGVIAHSFGALATGFAHRLGLKTRAVAFVAPAVSPRMALRGMQRLLDFPEPVRKNLEDRLARRTGVPLERVEEGRLFSAIEAPVFIAHDREDPEIAEEGIEALAEETGARVRWVSGLGHRRILRDADVIAEVTRHLAAVPAVQPGPWERFLYEELDGLLAA